MEPIESFGTDGILRPEFLVKFVVAVLCGGAIGMERETTGKPAGLRTCILVCLGSMLFTQVGIAMSQQFGGDAMRVAAQIVTGIGFLGAGVILHARQGEVRGVTTAAMIWLMAAIGMMIGAGYVISAMGVTAAAVVMILTLRRVESIVRNRHARDYSFALEDSAETRHRVSTLMSSYEEWVRRFELTTSGENELTLTFRFVGNSETRRELVNALCQLKGVRTEFTVHNWGRGEDRHAVARRHIQ